MDDPLDEKNSDGRFYLGLIAFVIIVVVGVSAMVIHQRGGIGGPPPPNVEDLRRDHLAAPGLTDQQVLEYSTEVLAKAVTFDAREFYNQLAELRPYFTNDGWTLFERTLERIDVVNMMQSGRFVVTPELAGEPKLVSSGVDAAIYQWRVAVPLKITLQSADRSLERVMIAHARIIRQSIDAFPEGIAIDSVNFLPEGGAGG